MFVHICARAHIDRNWQQHPSYFQQENIWNNSTNNTTKSNC
jgi:hypothetical protein